MIETLERAEPWSGDNILPRGSSIGIDLRSVRLVSLRLLRGLGIESTAMVFFVREGGVKVVERKEMGREEHYVYIIHLGIRLTVFFLLIN